MEYKYYINKTNKGFYYISREYTDQMITSKFSVHKIAMEYIDRINYQFLISLSEFSEPTTHDDYESARKNGVVDNIGFFGDLKYVEKIIDMLIDNDNIEAEKERKKQEIKTIDKVRYGE